MADTSGNPLISTRPSETGLSVSLHPLVLLTISDHVTRHSVRRQSGPVAGALLGQQKGREITVEHAFSTVLVQDNQEHWTFDVSWMETRIQQYRDVHKAPALDFVGWYTLCPESGPSVAQIPLQKQAITFYSDSAILLALHPEGLSPTNSTNGRLPVSIYESIQELDSHNDDASMQVDGQESASSLKFRPLSYSVDTDETEMIAIDYVAKGAGSAAAIPESSLSSDPASSVNPDISKGKSKITSTSTNGTSVDPSSETSVILTTEEQDAIANITTRLNSVKMLQSRIALLRQFIQSLPPSYLSDQTCLASPDPAHLPHLRSIQALLTRLSLLTPSDDSTSSTTVSALATAAQSQSNDVSLSHLLNLLSQDVQALSELGRTFHTVYQSQNSKAAKNLRDSAGGPGAGGTVGPAGGSSRGGNANGRGGSSGTGGFGGLEDSDGSFGGLASVGAGPSSSSGRGAVGSNSLQV
ncbi:hypothetical protein B0A52_06943 [Exophiala mesophila]|uniref:COP9 signalosome complex subunit 6 n=1 Tax=Exophiala mesophila TaxID=212818 RepID=A0A438N0U2_EXOME|nr:hypothetical protein B0A52_06943 [Exophiala mesophila]